MTLHMINSILRVTVQYKAAMFTVNSSSISRRVHLLWGKPNLQDCVLRSVFDGGIPPSRLRGESAEIGLQSRYQSHLRTPMLGFRGETWMLPGKEMNRKVWHRDRTVKLRSRGIGNGEGAEDLCDCVMFIMRMSRASNLLELYKIWVRSRDKPA